MKWMDKLFRLAILFPAFWWVYEIFFGDLGAEPAKELNHSTGLVALVYLVLNLWIGVLISLWKKRPSQLRFLVLGRRFLGVFTYLILIAHVFLYFALEAFDPKALTQLFEKTYLTFGTLAFLGMTILALTSNDRALRKLGGKRWKGLHRFVYFVMALVMGHIFLIEKADLIQFALITFPLWFFQFVRLLKWFVSNRNKTQLT